jgi:zeaxanthin glucosyltransferase
MTFRDSPDAIREARVDALLIDETDMSGTVAEHLGIPFVSIAIVPPFLDDDTVPPFYFGWPSGRDWFGRFRNRLARRLISLMTRPLAEVLNTQRREWGLKPIFRPTDSLSRIAQIAQLPRAIEFEAAQRLDILHYTGPWVNAAQRATVAFPWERLDEMAGGRPLVYASLGTLQNGAEPVFRAIAEACAGLPMQLVLSLGGGLDEERLGKLAGDPLVVRFAPQLELIKRAHVVITHAGINTALETLRAGVPLVAIPLGNDQPGVAARVAARGAGVVIPKSKLSAERLRRAVQLVLNEPGYRARAQELGRGLREIDGPAMAAEIIERTLNLSRATAAPQHAD